MVAVILGVSCGVVFVIMVVIWWRSLDAADTKRSMQAAKLTTGKNDDEAAVRHFVVLVKPATNDVVIHDDGDDAASLYHDRKVIAAVRERLDRGVTVRCLFNNRANLRMVDELRDHPGFTVHYLRQPPLSPEDVHFKIVDRGAWAYLSRHLEDGKREFRRYDCSKVPSEVRQRFFRGFLLEFDRGTRELAAA